MARQRGSFPPVVSAVVPGRRRAVVAAPDRPGDLDRHP